MGNCWDPDPNAASPEVFAYEVGYPELPPEPWRDGSVFIRNPNALHPLPPEWLGAGAEETLSDNGTIIPTFADPFHVYASQTLLFAGDAPERTVAAVVEQQVALLQMGQALGNQWRDAG